MNYNFDEEIDRFGTHCAKWEFVTENGRVVQTDRMHLRNGDQRLLPLWVADMDFRSPPEVIAALEARAAHGIFGYAMADDDYFAAVISWMARRYGRHIERDWLVITPGVIPAVYNLIQTFTSPGDKILIQPPVYHPFFHAIEDTGRIVARNPLQRRGRRYEMDFEDLARKAADPLVTMAILCSPHNPIGRVWTAGELRRFGEICRAHDVLVIADEIHADLIYDGFTFTSYATADESFAQHSIVCTAPSKTFNLPGLRTSNIIMPDEGMRERFTNTLLRHQSFGSNTFGLVATEAAYNHGEPWLASVMAYIQDNYRFLEAYLAEYLPQLTVIPPEGTYLVWIDLGALGLPPQAQASFLMDEAKVWLSEGQQFGEEGASCVRMNIACPRSLLAEALDRIRRAVNQLQSA